jgi:hypothetical protein
MKGIEGNNHDGNTMNSLKSDYGSITLKADNL